MQEPYCRSHQSSRCQSRDRRPTTRSASTVQQHITKTHTVAYLSSTEDGRQPASSSASSAAAMAYCVNSAVVRSSYNARISIRCPRTEDIRHSRAYSTIQPLGSQPPAILPRTLRHNGSNVTGLFRIAFIAMANIDNPAMTIQQALPCPPDTYNPRRSKLANSRPAAVSQIGNLMRLDNAVIG